MSRRRKDYVVGEVHAGTNSDVGPVVVQFPDTGQAFDFTLYQDFPGLYRYFAEAFRHHYAGKARTTRTVRFRELKWFFRFLRERRDDGAHLESAGDLTGELLRSFAGWLNRQPGLGLRTCSLHYGAAAEVLNDLRKRRADLFGHLDVPRQQFPGVGRAGLPKPRLSRAEAGSLIRVARVEATAVWSTFQRGRELVAEASQRLEREARAPVLNDLGEFLVLLGGEYAGVVPPCDYGQTPPHIVDAIRRHGGFERVARHLHATSSSLAPFAVLIGAETLANSDALLHFRRNCLTPDAILPGRFLVKWTKRRAKREQVRNLGGARDYSAPVCIERVLELTQPLLPFTPPEEQCYLFLTRSRNAGYRIGIAFVHALQVAMRRLLSAHGLDATRFTFSMLRPTGLALDYLKHQDVLRTSRKANHANLGVTMRYVVGTEVQRAHDLIVARAQADLVDLLQSPPLSTGAPQVARIAGALHPSGAFSCSEPLNGRSPRARAGELCPEWLWPLVDPGLVIPDDAHYVARLIQVAHHIRACRYEMAPERFQLVYKPLLELLEDEVLPRCSMPTRAAAEEIAARLAPLPDLPNE